MADFLFRCHRDYDGALKELAIARPGLPNDARVLHSFRLHQPASQHWPEAEHDFSTAVSLDPRNPNAYNLLADTYVLNAGLQAAQVYERVLATGERTPIVQYRLDSARYSGQAIQN